MPQFLKGDIFEAALRDNCDFAIVFGHIGYNEMADTWRRFCEKAQAAAAVQDPFVEYGRDPQELIPGRWFCFVADGENQGMTDERLKNELDRAVGWAEANLRCGPAIITNGIAETGKDANHDRRARLLAKLAGGIEGRGFRVSLISLSDVFVRP